MKFFKLFFGFILVVLVSGCATHAMTRQMKQTAPTLSSEAVFYIAINKDGSFGGKTYFKSGWMLSELIRKELSTEAYNIEMGEAYESYELAFSYSQNKGKDYLIYPEILHWENHPAALKGNPDKVKVKMTIIEVATGQTLDQMEFACESSSMTLGGEPQDLLPFPMRKYIESLFRNL